MDSQGVVRAQIDDTTSVAAFACALGAATAEALAAECFGTSGGQPRVYVDHDHDLGVTLVHRAFESRSAPQARRVTSDIDELLPVCAAEEIDWHLAS